MKSLKSRSLLRYLLVSLRFAWASVGRRNGGRKNRRLWSGRGVEKRSGSSLNKLFSSQFFFSPLSNSFIKYCTWKFFHMNFVLLISFDCTIRCLNVYDKFFLHTFVCETHR